MSTISISCKTARIAVRLLDAHSANLESAIEGEIVPGTKQAPRGKRTLVASLRREWRSNEDLKMLLEEKLRLAK